MSLFEKRYSKEEILHKVYLKRTEVPEYYGGKYYQPSEYFGIPKDYIMLPCLLLLVLVVLPLWLVFFVPLVLVYFLYKSPQLLKNIPGITPNIVMQEKSVGEIGSEYGPATDIIPFESRKYDIVVFGVTGHSGSLLAEYLIERYVKNGKGLKLAVAGRSQAKVAQSLVALAKNTEYPEAIDIPVIIADSTNQDSLYSMAKNTRVVSTTVGPFLKYGEPIVKACARYGTSYNDITGEDAFVKMMRANYGELARATGASIVSTSGYDSIPSDLGVLNVVEKFKERHGKIPERVDNLVESAFGGAAGGTIDTVIQFMDNGAPAGYILKGREKKGSITTDPFFGLGYNIIAKRWTFPFMMAPINAKVVESTNTSLGHTPKLHYNEVMVVPSLIADIFISMSTIIGASIVFFYPTRYLLFKYGILPKPGVGPSRRAMSQGFFTHRLIASTSDGLKEEVDLKVIGDPGGIFTALAQAEVAISLSKYGHRKDMVIKTGAGLTPGETLDTAAFTNTLRNTGLVVLE